MTVSVKSFSKSKSSTGTLSSGKNSISLKVADRLSGTHSIFGLPFNGTLDVSGDLSDVNNITATGDIATGGKLAIKDVQISKNSKGTKFEGGITYGFDGGILATSLDVDTLKATTGNIQTLLSGDATVDTLTVTRAAHFFSLIIDEIKSVGGLVIISPASATLDKVEKMEDGNFKCYFQSLIGNDRISNLFALNDLIVCQTFNVADGTSYNVSNTFYWRLLTSKGTETIDSVEYHYIILSGTDCAADSGEPKVGDKIVSLGNRSDADRLNAIILSAYNSDFLDTGLKAPSLVQYTGINDYTLTTHRKNVISNDLNLFVGNFTVSSGEEITDLINANKYNRLILDKATAIVDADSTLTVEISGSVIPVSGKTYTVTIESDLFLVTNLAKEDNTFSFKKEYTYSTGGATSFSVALKLDGTVIEKVNVPVIFKAGAVLSVMDDKIESAVLNIEGEISKVEQTATSIKAEVYDDLNNSTGIDIENGSITLNADKTTINGNLNIRNTDEGLIIYDADGNAKVMVLNKEIPTIDKLDTPLNSNYYVWNFTENKKDGDYILYNSRLVEVGTYKVGDTFSLYNSSLSITCDGKNVSLDNIKYCYQLKNTTTGDVTETTLTDGALSGYSCTIEAAGVYEISLVVYIYNADNTKTYKLKWYFGTEKEITDYTLIGTDGIVSVKGENLYLYYGNDGFIARGYDYSGLKVDATNHIKTVIGYNGSNETLWGNLNSGLKVVRITEDAPSITVKAGNETIGTKNVVRADSTYYDADVIVIALATAEVWIKLPPPYIVNGSSFNALLGKSLKIKNICSLGLRMYCENYKIYSPDTLESGYWWKLDGLAAEVVWTGLEWIWFRNN